MVRATFPADSPEHVADTMDGVVPKLDVDIGRALEDDLVHLVRHVRTAADAPKRVIDSDLVGRGFCGDVKVA